MTSKISSFNFMFKNLTKLVLLLTLIFTFASAKAYAATGCTVSSNPSIVNPNSTTTITFTLTNISGGGITFLEGGGVQIYPTHYDSNNQPNALFSNELSSDVFIPDHL